MYPTQFRTQCVTFWINEVKVLRPFFSLLSFFNNYSVNMPVCLDHFDISGAVNHSTSFSMI